MRVPSLLHSLFLLFPLLLLLSSSVSNASYVTLPEHPTAGCGSWVETFYFFDTENSDSENKFSGTIPKGSYAVNDLTTYFCTGDLPNLPLGSFCFYLNARLSSCPFGFSPGTRVQDEEDSNNQSKGGGNADDRPKLTGVIGNYPTWNFCCGSGNPSTVISFDAIRDSLPASFTLFRKNNACQKINGRRDAVEGMIHWDDDDYEPHRDTFTGAVPDGVLDRNTEWQYCTYGPSYLPYPTSSITLTTKTDISAQVSWTAPSGAGKYRVQLYDGSTQISSTVLSPISQSFASLTQNKVYTVYVYSGLYDSVTAADQFETVGKSFQFTTCSSGYSGLNCSAVCSPACIQGSCTTPNSCTCNTGWTGATCNQCKTGYYPSGGNCVGCPSCASGKGSCSDGPSGTGQCLCNTGYSGTLCTSCDLGYYSSGGNCLACDSTCYNCTTASTCTACKPGLLLQPDQTCASSCTNSTTYFNVTTNSCLGCNSNCQSCYGGATNQCLSCGSTRFMNGGECVDTCPSGSYFDSSKTCNSCIFPCSTCNGLSPLNCLSCHSPYLLNGTQCISPSDCTNGGGFSSSGSCSACDISCQTCSTGGSSGCTSCKAGGFLLNGQCLSSCPEGYYTNLDIKQCKPCTSPCLTCTSGSSNDCTSCSVPKKLSGSRCEDDCPVNFYFNSTINTCLTCSSQCLTCTGPGDACTFCKNELDNLLDGACVRNCPDGMFSSSSRKCQDCFSTCETCTTGSPDACTSCPPDRVSQQGECLLNCTDSFYLGDAGICKACHLSCETCSAAGPSGCLTCPASWVWNDGACITAEACTNLGRFNDSGICTACNAGCRTCSGPNATDCLSCQTPSFLFQGKCLLVCPAGYYGSEDSNQCKGCHPSCETCSSLSANDCKTCKSPLILSGSSCVSSCPVASFFDSTLNSCLACSSNCLTCNGTSKTCLSCQESYLLENTCVPSCPQGYAISKGECSAEAFKKHQRQVTAGAIVGVLGFLFLLAIVAFAFFTYKKKRDKAMLQVISKISMAQIRRDTSLEMAQADGGFIARPVSSAKSFVSATDQITLLNTTLDFSLPGFLLLNYATQLRQETPLGSGGAGSLFRGVLIDSSLIEKFKVENVVIKHVHPIPQYSEDKNRSFFNKEVSINWALHKSPNIVKMIGYCDEPRCIVLKMYECDLFSILQNPLEKFNSMRAFVLAFQISKGILAIHRINAAHRDLKTKNILIERGMTDNDRDIRAVICDFGLAVYDSDMAVFDPKVEENDILKGFSPKYAPPEIFSSHDNPDGLMAGYQKVDIYAYAIIIWELLSRKVPWDGYSLEQTKKAVLAGQRPIFPPPGEDPLMNVLIQIAEVCWNEDPFRRPAIYEITCKLEPFLEED